MNLDPKELRAQAKNLLELARTIEAMQDPETHVKKTINRKMAGMKRHMKYELARTLQGTKNS